ncbi:hypothetical protein EDB84DRAFT_1563819 [Lactarius hengduanensis]|nr:hypothetical protein EDB84DRAFT_1563819 [Lactarius hengduanensis]
MPPPYSRDVILATSKDTHSVPLDYSSYQANLQHLEEVVVALERVRFYFDPQLGHRFAVINRSLEELTKYIPPSDKLRIDGSGADDLRVVVPIGGRLLLKQRSQLKERDGLISQFRALPGFDSFLTSPRFDLFRSAANSWDEGVTQATHCVIFLSAPFGSVAGTHLGKAIISVIP